MVSFSNYCSQHFSPMTQRGYSFDLKRFSRWFTIHKGIPLKVVNISPDDITDYRCWLQVMRYKPSTIKRAMSAIHAFINWGQASSKSDK